MQRRTTRVTNRQALPENAPSMKPGIARASSAKTRSASTGLLATKPSNPVTTNHVASSKTTKPPATKDNVPSSTAASIKRKREALTENAGVKGLRPKAPAVDKENHQVKKPHAYVELPNPTIPAAARSRTTTTTTTSRTTTSAIGTTRSRIQVKRDDDVAVARPVKAEPESQPQIPSDDDVMAIDDTEPQARTSTRHLHPRSSNGASASQQRRSSGTAKRPTSSRSSRRVKHEEPVEDEVQPVAKKRRTSSVGPDDKVAIFEEPADEPVVLDTHLEETKVNAALEEAKWEELDREDDADPLMVSEYVVEIFQYLRKLEIETLPDPLYMNGQPDLAWKMRGILMDWLIQVHNRFRMLPETLFLAVNIVDRFLSVRAVSLVKLQLMGITAMFIASKYEEIMSPALSHYMECTEHSYEDGDILEAEQYILSSIDYNLSYPNPVTFLRRASKADGYDLPTRTVAKYLIEISCVDYRFLPHPPSQVAAAGIWFARLILEKDDWTPTLAHFSGWKEDDIIPVVQLMVTYLLRAVKHECFYQKYASKKYMKVSKYVREWLWAKFGQAAVVDYDADGEPTTGVDPTLHIVPSPGSISLADELPRLREEIRLAREAEGLLLQPVAEADE